MKILIIYGTTEGQTRKVAEYLKKDFEKHAHEVTLADANDTPPSPEGFDAVIIGASMHMERYQEPVLYYIREHHSALNKVTSAFYSVSLTAASDDAQTWHELRYITDRFIGAGQWKPDLLEFVAGALRYTKYDFMKKFIMRQIARRAHHTLAENSADCEYTDWEALSRFAARMERIAASVPVIVDKEETDYDAIC